MEGSEEGKEVVEMEVVKEVVNSVEVMEVVDLEVEG